MDIASELAGIVGKENVSTDELDLLCYGRDMAPMPDELLTSYGMIPPEAVARPGRAEEVASILKWASERGVPVTPRAGGSWALGGTIPIEGGLVLDLSRMDGIVEVNEENGYVRVGGGVSWKRLSDALERRGLRVGTYPSSAPSAAVAGFLSTGGGGGIGAAMHGPAGDQVLSLKVVLSDGRIVETDPWSSWLFIGAEGTLGIICEAVLKVFPLQPMHHVMLAFDDPGRGWEAFRRLYALRPYFLTFIDRGFAQALNESAQEGHEKLPERELAFVASFTGPEEALFNIRKEIEDSWPNELCESGLAREEWENRFRAVLSTKALGPTIFSPEIQIPIAQLPEAFVELERAMGSRRHGMEGMAIGGDAVTILPIIYTDERDSADFLKVFSFTRDITDIGYRCGGCVYGIGLHNSNHMGKIHGRGLDVMRRIRAEIEPSGALNPSKTTQVRLPYFLLRISMSAMDGLPWLVAAGLRLAGLVPRPLLRLGLRVFGSQQR